MTQEEKTIKIPKYGELSFVEDNSNFCCIYCVLCKDCGKSFETDFALCTHSQREDGKNGYFVKKTNNNP